MGMGIISLLRGNGISFTSRLLILLPIIYIVPPCKFTFSTRSFKKESVGAAAPGCNPRYRICQQTNAVIGSKPSDLSQSA